MTSIRAGPSHFGAIGPFYWKYEDQYFTILPEEREFAVKSKTFICEQIFLSTIDLLIDRAAREYAFTSGYE